MISVLINQYGININKSNLLQILSKKKKLRVIYVVRSLFFYFILFMANILATHYMEDYGCNRRVVFHLNLLDHLWNLFWRRLYLKRPVTHKWTSVLFEFGSLHKMLKLELNPTWPCRNKITMNLLLYFAPNLLRKIDLTFF